MNEATCKNTLEALPPCVAVPRPAWKTILNALDALLDRASKEICDPPDVPEIEGAHQALILARKIYDERGNPAASVSEGE